MRTTVDIDEKLLKEAWDVVHPASKRELIEQCLKETVRRARLKRLASRLGKIPMITLEEFLRLRRRG